LAFQYWKYLGTSTKTAEQIKGELYDMACTMSAQINNDRMFVYVTGLAENFDKALALLEERLNDSKADPDIYNNLVNNTLRQRLNAKTDQSSNFSALVAYGVYGAKSPTTNILSEAELKAMKPETLLDKVKALKGLQHTIMYYGPLSEQQVSDVLNKSHVTSETLAPVTAVHPFIEQETKENTVLLANYDAKQIYMDMLHKSVPFDKNLEARRELYNEYFGGGMNTVVFQEMREARALAYSANAFFQMPDRAEDSYYMRTFTASQTDKMTDAIHTFLSILNDMPKSQKNFDLAKASLMKNLRTDRILREDILWNYLDAKRMGYDTDKRKDMFEQIPKLTMDDMIGFQQQYVKGVPYTYCILGDLKSLNMETLKALGPVKILSQRDIFGY
jgi:predicted Zn-dependent peptidase